MDKITKIINNVTDENQKDVDWTEVWSSKYPILTKYQKEVDIESYAKRIRQMLDELQDNYDYSQEDAMLVLKDILAHEYLDNIKK
ncbi:hypothetical protein [uncultured Methanobrevibacter sp.]|nr:hypothetical protein [uncultured Methanobrevibacter sp.]